MTNKELFIHCVEKRGGIFLEREKRQIIEALEILDILKNECCLLWVERMVYGESILCGRYADVEIPLDEDDFNGKENYDKVMRWLKNDK